MNCLNPSEGEPCGKCENCLAIDRGVFPDLIEIDAASNRGIDDIRAIRDAVSYTPIKGRYKVYILDEAHMLTKEAFNALLKTLEEPPPRTIFILCTTEYEKIMPTILSRCQRLIFSRLRDEEIAQHLKSICEKEGLQYEDRALMTIAKISGGAMRDAVSLLDQISIYGEGKVNSELLEEFLGIVSQDRVRDFLKMLLNAEVDNALNFLRDISQKGFNLLRFWDFLEEELNSLILYKSLKDPERVIRVDDFHRQLKDAPLNALLYLEKVINTARLDARSRDFIRACELAVVKTQIVKDILPIGELLSHLSSQRVSGESKSQEEAKEDPLKDLEGKLDTLILEVLRRSRREFKGDKVVFYIREGELKEQDMQKIRALNPRIDFLIETEKEEGSLPPFVEKVKDIFGAKLISHEQRGKGKGTSGKGS